MRRDRGVVRGWIAGLKVGPIWSFILMAGGIGCQWGTPGELGQESFRYSCVDESDPYCDHGSCVALGEDFCDALVDHRSQIPSAISRGSRFGLSAPWSYYHLQSASPAMVSNVAGVSGIFRAHEEGRVAVMASSSAGVVDFVYLRIEDPSHLKLSGMSKDGQILLGTLTVAPGEETWLRVTPHGSGGGALAGALPVAWQVESEGAVSAVPVSISPTSGDNLVRLLGIAPGSATVRVSLGDLTTSVEVRVVDPEACTGECCVVTGCVPLDPARQCCPDVYGQERICLVEPGDASGLCVLPCDEPSDCYWSTTCEPSERHCVPVPCGGDGTGVSGGLEEPCLVGQGDEAATGVCMGSLRTDPDVVVGYCLEAGSLLPGEPCQVSPDPLAVPRWDPQCAQGVCEAEPGSAEGLCVGLCHWESSYDAVFYSEDATAVILPCAPGWSCVSTAHLDPVHGLRQPGLSRCLLSWETDPHQGIGACSLVTGTLLGAKDTTCASALGEPEAGCQPVTRGLPVGVEALGSLIGVCASAPPGSPPDRALWADCSDPGAACPTGSRCMPEAALWGEVSGPKRCLPYCDAGRAPLGEDACLERILSENPSAEVTGPLVCLSLSFAWDDPEAGQLGGQDRSPTRLGLCQVMP